MLNRNSAITEKYNIGKYPFEDNIEIIFSENRNLTIQQIAAWPDEISNIEKKTKASLDFLTSELKKEAHENRKNISSKQERLVTEEFKKLKTDISNN